jgi:hypothetical protein
VAELVEAWSGVWLICQLVNWSIGSIVDWLIGQLVKSLYYEFGAWGLGLGTWGLGL